MNKRATLIVLTMALIVMLPGLSLAASTYSEDFSAATGVPPILSSSVDGTFSQKWAATNYYIGGLVTEQGWTFSGQAYLAENAQNGDKAILLNEGGGGLGHGSMSTMISNATPGNYQLSFEYWGDNRPNIPYQFTVSVGSSSQTITGSWTQAMSGTSNTAVVPFSLASSGNIQLQLSFLDKSSYQASAIIDNIKVSSVPLPGAIWLLGSGLAALIGVRRKYGA